MRLLSKCRPSSDHQTRQGRACVRACTDHQREGSWGSGLMSFLEGLEGRRHARRAEAGGRPVSARQVDFSSRAMENHPLSRRRIEKAEVPAGDPGLAAHPARPPAPTCTSLHLTVPIAPLPGDGSLLSAPNTNPALPCFSLRPSRKKQGGGRQVKEWGPRTCVLSPPSSHWLSDSGALRTQRSWVALSLLASVDGQGEAGAGVLPCRGIQSSFLEGSVCPSQPDFTQGRGPQLESLAGTRAVPTPCTLLKFSCSARLPLTPAERKLLQEGLPAGHLCTRKTTVASAAAGPALCQGTSPPCIPHRGQRQEYTCMDCRAGIQGRGERSRIHLLSPRSRLHFYLECHLIRMPIRGSVFIKCLLNKRTSLHVYTHHTFRQMLLFWSTLVPFHILPGHLLTWRPEGTQGQKAPLETSPLPRLWDRTTCNRTGTQRPLQNSGNKPQASLLREQALVTLVLSSFSGTRTVALISGARVPGLGPRSQNCLYLVEMGQRHHPGPRIPQAQTKACSESGRSSLPSPRFCPQALPLCRGPAKLPALYPNGGLRGLFRMNPLASHYHCLPQPSPEFLKLGFGGAAYPGRLGQGRLALRLQAVRPVLPTPAPLELEAPSLLPPPQGAQRRLKGPRGFCIPHQHRPTGQLFPGGSLLRPCLHPAVYLLPRAVWPRTVGQCTEAGSLGERARVWEGEGTRALFSKLRTRAKAAPRHLGPNRGKAEAGSGLVGGRRNQAADREEARTKSKDSCDRKGRAQAARHQNSTAGTGLEGGEASGTKVIPYLAFSAFRSPHLIHCLRTRAALLGCPSLLLHTFQARMKNQTPYLGKIPSKRVMACQFWGGGVPGGGGGDGRGGRWSSWCAVHWVQEAACEAFKLGQQGPILDF
ncbi:hypothetical protein Cadr_000024300 [Camelus dromedarius]|uniref:Uncharacterized protein n=1 Tax=Camelus dromedarius TaxID=9838 RepID=A0A5N4CPC3_CAMDR|nr:hypothetical protein Cadr_000024300 [Camelus dromedarius]